jgi:uncharacterized cofD-like protein
VNARAAATGTGQLRGPGDGSRAVAVGGGHGLARTLAALPEVVDHVTAVVTVADDGGSSGRLRRDLGVLPPGDLRMALTALAQDSELAEVVRYRFTRGELGGHSLGNLVLVALEDQCGGDVIAALDRLARLLDVPGRVLPCTTAEVTLRGRTASGEVTGQAAVGSTPGLQRVWLDPRDPPATPDAIIAIERADLVVLGPGSLYTSLLPNLLVPGIAAALAATSAPVVLVGNLREQPGETQGLALHDHLDVLAGHVPGLRLDVVVAHDGPAPAGGGAPLKPDLAELEARVPSVAVDDLLDGHDGHDPVRLAGLLAQVLDG